MPLYLSSNTLSLSTQRYLNHNTNMLASSMEKLSSGYRINHSSDDAAGLQLSEKLRAQIRGTTQAGNNAQDGINVLNIADGSLQQITDNLQRMRELAVQAGNDTYSSTQRTSMQNEMTQLATDITRISTSTQFNGNTLLDGSMATFNLQVGANNTAANDVLNVGSAFANSTAAALSVNALTVNNSANALAAITSIDSAIDTVNTQRGNIGAYVNRLNGAVTNLANATQNFSASEARIRDVDVASESAKLTQAQILQQAATAMLTQANQSPSLALKLLG